MYAEAHRISSVSGGQLEYFAGVLHLPALPPRRVQKDKRKIRC